MTSKDIAYHRKSAQQRRAELIDAGIACLGQGGMTAFTIDRICKQAGVSRGLINHHFKTKEELMVSIYSQMTDYLLHDRSRQSPAAQIVGFIDSSFDAASFDKSNLRAWLAIWGQVATRPELKSLHQDRYRHYRRQLAQALSTIAQNRQLEIDPDSVARQLIALIDGLWLEYCLHSDGFSLADAREDCYRLLEGVGIALDKTHASQR
ncbi:MAG: TetR family transcriptional regulator C-terminal domain-containing protein [Gammaproteobacteria bacterium]|nr:TetR family transcriptional regulator C-terminal domain-containing protein [Gammaproteobacteria bacterium]